MNSDDDSLVAGSLQRRYTSTGRLSGYQVNLYHKGLDEHKHLTAMDQDVLLGKVHNQNLVWQAKWEKASLRSQRQSKEEQAEDLSEVALQRISEIETILTDALKISNSIDWESLKNKDSFSTKLTFDLYIQSNRKDGYPETYSPEYLAPLNKEEYFRKISLLMRLLGQRERIALKQQKLYDDALLNWNKSDEAIKEENRSRDRKLNDCRKKWEAEKQAFERIRDDNNAKIDDLKNRYEGKDAAAIAEYCEMVLGNSIYPTNFKRQADIQYNDSNGMLLVDYQLPPLRDIPTLTAVKYVKARDALEEKHMSEAAHAKIYDGVVYCTILRTMFELFSSDTINAIVAINLNGIVSDVSPATGHVETHCIASVQVKKDEFLKVNLAAVDPKQCFKSFKGVGSSKLSTMTPIAPILELNKTDKRFTTPYEVVSGLNEAANLAAMDWEDFEQLVRELFEQEFAVNGGEVKVTRVSVDGGVDAVAFDPDPIRGGKIVIQAKRYTNTVGVSAVRDLYGTMMNEGANKGILVTTSDYGSDSYEFAKGKPLTLLNGANLLSLLEKHGHRAKIDIKEAKKILKETAG